MRTLTPTLQWDVSRSDLFYYEFQLSKDVTFNTDPATATAMIYTSLRHGGVTSPWNSYEVPGSSPLEDKTTYYWRVRPRVQGDGTPASWSALFSFKTDLSLGASFSVGPFSFGTTTANAETCLIAGATNSFASNPSLTGVHYAFKHTGVGSISISQYSEDGQPIGAFAVDLSASSGCVRRVAGRSDPNTSAPLNPGTYKREVWYAGQKLQSSTFTIVPASAFTLGPLIVGTGVTSSSTCTLSGTSSSFSSAAKVLYGRHNFVGSGSYTAAIWRGTTKIAQSPAYELEGPTGCSYDSYTPTAGFQSGPHRWELSVGGTVVQSVSFTIS